ncbi:tripartite tricarboxylate transporter substrate binding protein [Bradyrhizobium manausense]|uniref:Bug family tripartite tricarboxylate transporter substrate binding protein n=1 Tax=Bradyrhizobium manausense TaxID=989370 RepID=UPI001BA9F106|nr:tripartite tricarboxylate transporter substrate binding protein [Bradyrhizobium manausense]MBR0725501.1 tripartite tricarboxylate transporter substrate binding protein [Bradyrhizobium manausense]MBR0834185.1 tripartite tricarboxylate transporter substrate binding protein [Bradyrhizobium manausense]
MKAETINLRRGARSGGPLGAMLRLLAGSLAAASLSSQAARATDEAFPNRQVTIVSPYQAGGTSDIIARLIARKLSDSWKQPVIVENKPGANGSIGIMAVIKAPADGYTLLAVASSALTINPLIYRNLPYDVGRDLAPVTRTGLVPNVLVVNPALPAKNVAELITLARTRPGKLNYASQGNGSNGHLTGEMFRQRAGIDIVHIPYKGSAPAVTDLVSGQVDLMFDNLPSVLGQIQSGQLRPLAVTTSAPAALLPGIPTVSDAGFPGFESSAWFAVLVSAQTPEPVRARLEAATVTLLKDEDVSRRLAELGVTVTAGGSAELASRIQGESQTWREIVTKAGIAVE